MNPRQLDRALFALCLLYAALTTPHYIPNPWIAIPATITLAWAAGDRLGAALTHHRDRP